LIDQEAIAEKSAKFEQWARDQLQACGEYAQQNGLITAEASAKAGWAVPGQVFVGLVSSRLNPDLSFWVITGPAAMPDHIEAKIAANAREAVRHFALRWQLHGAQAETMAGDGAPAAITDATAESSSPAEVPATDGSVWTEQGAALAKRAEELYALTLDDRLWPSEGD
jgi:Domain of unknown function (DUF4826)